jgi:hypothetical protein
MRAEYAECFLSFFVSKEMKQVEYPEPTPEFDLYIERDVLATEIIEIIEESNPVFQQLTRHRINNRCLTPML